MTKGAITEGSILEITVTTAEGKVISTNLKVTAEDMALVDQLKEMSSSL